MANPILITYATKYGATAEISEKISKVIADEGFKCDVLPINKVRDIQAYKAVILGSAVFIGQWRKEAVKFLKINKDNLKKQLVWIFSSGPTGEGDPVQLLQGWRIPKKVKPIADDIKPHDIAVFHGSVEVKKLSGLHKWMVNKVDAPVGDFRDWDSITLWAKQVAAKLKQELG